MLLSEFMLPNVGNMSFGQFIKTKIHSCSRCTEYVWELEKYIYGALCYEKPARFGFGKRKVEVVENKSEEVR